MIPQDYQRRSNVDFMLVWVQYNGLKHGREDEIKWKPNIKKRKHIGSAAAIWS